MRWFGALVLLSLGLMFVLPLFWKPARAFPLYSARIAYASRWGIPEVVSRWLYGLIGLACLAAGLAFATALIPVAAQFR